MAIREMSDLSHPSLLAMLDRLTEVLGSYRFRAASEVQLHAGIAAALTAAAIPFEHEKVLPGGGRVDFFLPQSGIALEVKIGGTLAQALLQVNRYLKEAPVNAAALIATRPWARGEIPCVQGKPVRLIKIVTQAF